VDTQGLPRTRHRPRRLLSGLPSAAVTRHRLARDSLTALIAYAVIAVVELWPLIHHFGSSVLYGATDSTGTLRDYWAAGYQGKNPFTFRHDAFDGAPEGYPRSPALTVANAAQPAFIWATKGIFGLVGAWNVVTIGGFVGSALGMFVLLRWLGASRVASFIGGYVFGFGPWMFDRAYAGHAGMQHLWVLPLLFATCVSLHRRRTAVRACAVGAALALSMYLHSYIGLMAAVIAAGFYVLELATRSGRLQTVGLGMLSLLTALVLFAPPLVMYARNTSSVSNAIHNPIAELYSGGATLRDYVLPSARNPIIGSLRPISLEGEHTLFFGYVTLILAIAGAWIVLRREAHADRGERVWLAGFAIVVAVLGLITSFKPTMDVAGLRIPTPSDAIGRVVPYWRAYDRVGVDVGLALIVLAAFAVDRILATRRGLMYVGGLTAVLVAELAMTLPVPTWRTSTVLPHIRWLADHPGGIVANYPLPIEAPALGLGAEEYWYQTIDKHPLFALWGGNNGGTREEAVRIVASNLDDPNAGRVLAAEHVRYVAVHDDLYRSEGATPPSLDPTEYTLVAHTSDDVRIFTVSAKPLDLASYLLAQSQRIAEARAYPEPVAAYGGGYNAPETFTDGRKWRWMTQNGDVDVTSVLPGRYLLILDAFSNAIPRTLTLVDARGHTLGTRTVEKYEKTLTFGPFQLPGPTTLNLVAAPGPEPLSATDTREASVYLAPFELRPAPDFYGSLNR
jgi:hypothetical protein